LEHLLSLLNERTKLVAVGYASNSVGTVNDVAAITRAAHDAGAWCFVDAVHYAPHGSIDVRELGCDFLACSAYKFFGPHVGMLYGKAEHMETLRPYKVRPSPNEIPDRWETGTQNHEGLAGVIAAIEYLAEVGRRHSSGTDVSRREALVAAMNLTRSYERELSERLIPALLNVPGLTFYGIKDCAQFGGRTPTVSIRMEGATPRELAAFLGRRGIFAWDGNYYALNISERLGVEDRGGMVRIGLVHYNTAEEIDRLIAALEELSRGTRA
jgi:cysteine desulfurase family protein (TIGR01976 family)